MNKPIDRKEIIRVMHSNQEVMQILEKYPIDEQEEMIDLIQELWNAGIRPKDLEPFKATLFCDEHMKKSPSSTLAGA